MATTQQKEELIEAFKGPHFYRVRLWGYGAETAYMKISEEAYNFWHAHTEEHGDSDACEYVLNAEDNAADEVNENGDYEDLPEGGIPREAMFMHDEEGVGSTYYEPIDLFDTVWGVASDAAYLSVEKVDGTDWDCNVLDDVIEGQDLNEFLNEVGEESDYEVEPYVEDSGYGDNFPEKGTHICQFSSSEKGTFFEAIVETPLLFNKNLLKFAISEAPNGEDTVFAVEYDGEELGNDGGDTNGKGYFAYFYKQEF